MKVLVAYVSQTGNTEKVARAIYGELPTEKAIKPLAETGTLDGFDFAFIGFPIQQFGIPQEVRTFLTDHAVGKRIAVFMTHAAEEGSDSVAGYCAQVRQATAGAEVAGVFDCQGELPIHVKNYLLNSGNLEYRAWAEGDSSQGQPNAARLERARVFAREIMAQAN